MARLSISYISKPYQVSQAWGIYNPAYTQFGFDHHNGIDSLLGADKKIYAPCPLVVLAAGFYPNGAGNYITARTTEKVDLDGMESSYVTMCFMHLEKVDVTVNQTLQTGDYMAIADNTGFSTGPHTHWLCMRSDEFGNKLDKNNANGSFDQKPYFNGKYAIDIKVGFLKQKLADIIALFNKLYPKK